MKEGNIFEDKLYYKEIKKELKPFYFSEISDALYMEDKDKIQSLLFKYMRKKDAQIYYPMIVEDLNSIALNREQESLRSSRVETMTLAQVIGYLKARLSIDELDEVLGIIKLGELDLC